MNFLKILKIFPDALTADSQNVDITYIKGAVSSIDLRQPFVFLEVIF